MRRTPLQKLQPLHEDKQGHDKITSLSIGTKEALSLIGCGISRFRDLERNDYHFPKRSILSRPNHPRWSRREMMAYAESITKGQE